MGEEEIKVGMITKRAQQKKSFGPVNFKDRVFVLTKSKLAYYEGTETQRGKIKGSFDVSSITFAGPINDKALNRTSAFQIIHDGCILYCCAKSETDRNSWIQAIKQARLRHQKPTDMQSKFHPNIYQNGKWQCCGRNNKQDQGCKETDELGYNSPQNYDKPLPDIPEDTFAPEYPPRFSETSRPSIAGTLPQGNFPGLPPKPKQLEISNIASAISQSLLTDDISSPTSSSWNQPSQYNSNVPMSSSSYPQQSHQPYNPPSHMVSSTGISSSHHTTSSYNAETTGMMSQRLGQIMASSALSNPNGTFDDEPLVPSYPHYVRGNKQLENMIQSKSYEFNPIRAKKLPPAPHEESRKNKVVVAIYNFDPMERGDIALAIGERYTVMDDTRPHWWLVRDSHGNEGHAPSNYLKDEESDGIESMSWFQKEMSRQRAEYLLKQDGKEGSFIVRNSTQASVVYTLSVVSKAGYVSGPLQVKHYHIKENNQGQFYLSEKHPQTTVMEVINYHKHNAGGLVTRLRNAPVCLQNPDQPSTHLFSNSEWEIDYNDLQMIQELGSGQFGSVKLATYRNSTYVAVKIMKENAMEEDSFIEEAEVMTRLKHKNLVSLYGVVTKQRPICIVTEFMTEGCLLDYIRKHSYLQTHPDTLLDICHQVCAAMQFLEEKNLIHRDLAARNCLVGKNMIIKVADFGLTRYVLDDEYTSSLGSKFPIKWAAPEVLNYTKFSSKSDVWAFGVLMWELFTGGKMPFAALSNPEVVEQVARGLRLSRPANCPQEVYRVMEKTWEMEPEQRPSFYNLYESFYDLIDLVAASLPPEGMYDA